MTQQQVADAVFINRAYYSQLECGSRSPSRDVANKIAKVLHFSPVAFFSEETNDPFRFALQDTPVVLAHCNTQLEYTWIYNPDNEIQTDHIIGKRDDELEQNEGIKNLMNLKQQVLDTLASLRRQIQFPSPTGLLTYWYFAKPLYRHDNQIIGVITTAIEISNFVEIKEESII